MPKGTVKIEVERCKACGFCVEFCPSHVLALSSAFNSKGYHPPHVVDPEKCSGCDLCVRDWSEACQSEIERRSLFRRRRSLCHWRQSPDPRRTTQCRYQGHLREQPDLCDDRRTNRANHTCRRHYFHQSVRNLRSHVQPSAPDGSCRCRICRALDHLSRSPGYARDPGSIFEARFQLHRDFVAMSNALPAP
jgi:NAD-dependent dihydropyrimidine dehydrogenase PreA subunit